MTKIKIKNGIIKGVILLFVLATMLGGILSHTLTAAAQQTEVNEEYVPNVYFNYADALMDPITVRTSEGAYKEPTAYVYYGRAYNSSTGTYMPMLNRVLDSSRDNAGNAGAIFLLAENVVNYARFSPYSDDDTAAYMDDENSYVDSGLVKKVYSGGYTAYETPYINTSTLGALAQELDYIRAITKTDDGSAVDGYYGLSTESGGYYWVVVDADGNDVGSLDLLKDSRVFPLSAEEVYSYIGTSRFSNIEAQAVFVATDMRNGIVQSWWLRSAIADSESSGSLVGIVDASGNVTYSSATNELANRNAFNIETSDIAFVERLSDGVYRIAFNAPEYKSGAQLEASVFDVRDGIVTVEVSNHIGQNGWNAVDDSCISYIVTDDQGNAKYYGVADSIRTSSGYDEKISVKEKFSFALPGCYEQGDKIKVFFERKDLSGQSYTSYVSNMVDIGCIHTSEGGSEAYCHQEAVCGVCGEVYGTIDEDNHRVVAERWIYNEDLGTHSRYCAVCDVAVYTEKCNFGPYDLSTPNTCEYNECNDCGHVVDAPSLHNYGSNGVCTDADGEYHYSMPELTDYINIGFEVYISNPGEWNALAEWLNSGGVHFFSNEMKNIILTGNLDFTGLEFVPIGTEEYPARNITINAFHRTFTGISYTAVGDAPVGVIGVGENVSVSDLIIRDSSFSGAAEAGAVVGKLLDTEERVSTFKNIAVIDVAVDAPLAGGVVGTLESRADLSASFIYNVTAGGVNLGFSYSGNLYPTPASSNGTDLYGGSYRLADESNGIDAFTEAEFATGVITYRLRQIDPKWRQTIGKDKCPRYATEGDESGRVYKITSCDGDRIIYGNENIGQISHGDYVAYDASTLEWIDGMGDFGVGFSVSVQCGLCGEYTTIELEAAYNFIYSYTRKFIARGEFDAYITVNGESVKINDEPYVIYSTKLEDLIGMTPVTIQYDGNYYDAAGTLLTNVREGLSSYDYEAYFLDPVTNERISRIEYDYYGRPVYVPAMVRDVGVYDLLIVGIDAFEGYEYVYEDVFEIKKSSVTVNPVDVVKIYDGTAVFEPEYELLGDLVYDLWFDISIQNAPSAQIGRYELKVTVDPDSHGHGDNISVTLAKDTVEAVIAPDLTVKLENRSYPETFTYGDTIVTPTASHFNISEGANISYQWFTAGYDYYEGYYPLRKIDLPKDAGEYILRVFASSNDGGMISSHLDIPVQILPRALKIELTPPADAEKLPMYSNGYGAEYYYVLEVGEQFSYSIDGFAYGEDLASAGIEMQIILKDEYSGTVDEGPATGNPVIPRKGLYQITYYVSGNDNYESDTKVIYVAVNSPDYTYPVETEFVTDGSPISPNLLISGPSVDVIPDGEEFDYVITVTDSDGQVIISKNEHGVSSISEIYLYNAATVTYYDGYMRTDRGVFTKAGEYTVNTKIEGESGTYTYEYSFRLEFYNENMESLNEIVNFGIYTVRVINADGSVVKEATLYAQQKVVMNLKPHEYNVSDGTVEYDPKKVIMEAGNVIHLEHTLIEVYFDVSESQGMIYAVGLKAVDKNGRDVSRLYVVERDTQSWPSHTDALNICHIFDNPCDHDCNVNGCEYFRAVEHTGGIATCQELAVCAECGTCYGEYSTERHVSAHTVVYPNLDDLDVSHLIVYTCCGATQKTVGHTQIAPATCTERAVCSECGWSYGELDPSNHSGTECTYEAKGDYHEVTHTCCGLTENEDHEGGVAYCNALAICEHCGGSYGVKDPENHAEAASYVPDAEDETIHREHYACCDKQTTYKHTGGDATCNARAVCTDCKAAYGELEPDDHASEDIRYERDMDNPSLHDIYHACCDLYIDKEYHVGGIANCQSPAICDLCGNTYGEKDYRTHASENYAYYALQDNPSLHVKVAACCGEFAGNEEHSYGEPTCTHASRCACGAEQGEKIEHVYDNDCDAFCNICAEQTRATAFHVGKDGKPCQICGALIPKEPISGGAIAAIATGSTVTASAGGFALFWFIIKKKSLSELLGLLLK